MDEPAERAVYAEAVSRLLAALPPLSEPHPEELFFVFERCRPGKEIKALQDNARQWRPEFGVGIWLHQEPPVTWTREEFEAATPGTLRPVIERVVRLQREQRVQMSAWRTLLGSGALLRVYGMKADAFVRGASEVLRPTVSDPSLTSFPFYVPLLRADTLCAPSETYSQDFSAYVPEATAYVRESVEDGGLLVVCKLPERIRTGTLEALSRAFAFEQLEPAGRTPSLPSGAGA